MSANETTQQRRSPIGSSVYCGHSFAAYAFHVSRISDLQHCVEAWDGENRHLVGWVDSDGGTFEAVGDDNRADLPAALVEVIGEHEGGDYWFSPRAWADRLEDDVPRISFASL